MNLPPPNNLIVLFRFLGHCFRLTGFTGRMSSLLGLLIQILIFFQKHIYGPIFEGQCLPSFLAILISSINFMASRESSSEI